MNTGIPLFSPCRPPPLLPLLFISFLSIDYLALFPYPKAMPENGAFLAVFKTIFPFRMSFVLFPLLRDA